MFQQAAEIGASERRQTFALVLRHEYVVPALGIDQGLMKVPAAGIVAPVRRAAHEGGEVAHPAADLARGGAEQERVVGGFQRRPCREGALELARPPLVLDRPQRQPDLLVGLGQRREHRLHQIHVGFGVIGKARLHMRTLDRERAHAGNAGVLVVEVVLCDTQQIPLDLQADDAAEPHVRQPPEMLAQQLPGREVKRHAAGEVFVAQDPADAGRPGQHAKGGEVGNDGEIGRAGHLGEAHAAAARERGEDAGIGGIEGGGRDVDVVAGGERGQEGRHRHRLGARRAVRVGPGQANELKLVQLDPALDLLGLPSLLIAPEAVPFDEIRASWSPANFRASCRKGGGL